VGDQDKPVRRQYNSPVRRQRAEQTRERIIDSGAAIIRSSQHWTWDVLTFSAVAAHASVGESTVYRYFPNERTLHDAVLHRLQQDAGISYESLTPDDLPRIATQLFTALTGFAFSRSRDDESSPVTLDLDRFKRQSLIDVVATAAPAWSERDRVSAAATLDILWNVPSYERLVDRWEMTPAEATATIEWAMRRIIETFTPGPRPDHDWTSTSALGETEA
jgi:AcrR family transcriptional regulator